MYETRSLTPSLSTAFRQAAYQVHTPGGEIELRIGKASQKLKAQMARLGVKHAAILTAYNPQACPGGQV